MFSINWIAGNGAEMIYPATDVNFTPYSANGNIDGSPRKATVSFNTDGTHCTIDNGRVFVMNDAGKTIRRFILEGDAEYPHGLTERIAETA